MIHAVIWQSVPDVFDGFALEIEEIRTIGRNKKMVISLDTFWFSTVTIAINYAIRNNLSIVYK